MRRRAFLQINKAFMDFVTFVPTGFLKGYPTWQNNLKRVMTAPFPVVWGVTRT